MSMPHLYVKTLTVFISLIFGFHAGILIPSLAPVKHHATKNHTQENSGSCQTSCLPIQIKKVKVPRISFKKQLRQFSTPTNNPSIDATQKETHTMTAFLYSQSSWIPPDIVILQGLAQTSR